MSDPIPTPALEDRLGAVVDSIKKTIITLPKFKPADVALAAEFDSMVGSLLGTLVDISAASAIDERSIILARDLSAARQAAALGSQKLRDQADADIRNAALPFPARGAVG